MPSLHADISQDWVCTDIARAVNSCVHLSWCVQRVFILGLWFLHAFLPIFCNDPCFLFTPLGSSGCSRASPAVWLESCALQILRMIRMSLYLDLRISHLSCCVLSERQGWDCFHIRPARKQISLSAPQPEIRDNILSFLQLYPRILSFMPPA